jgi:hypothetical protein
MSVALQCSACPLFQAAGANFNPHAQTKVDTKNEPRTGASHLGSKTARSRRPSASRHTVVPAFRAASELTEFADRDHSLTIDHGWRGIADSVNRG